MMGNMDVATTVRGSKYVVYATAGEYRELYGKITDRKKVQVTFHLK